MYMATNIEDQIRHSSLDFQVCIIASHGNENIAHGSVALSIDDRQVDAKSDLHFLSVRVGTIMIGYKLTKQHGSILNL